MASPVAAFNQIGGCKFKSIKNIKDCDLNTVYKTERFKKIKEELQAVNSTSSRRL